MSTDSVLIKAGMLHPARLGHLDQVEHVIPLCVEPTSLVALAVALGFYGEVGENSRPHAYAPLAAGHLRFPCRALGGTILSGGANAASTSFRSASRAASLGRRGGGKMGSRSSGTPQFP